MTVETMSGGTLRRISLEEPPAEQIHQTLLSAILSLELAPGTRVSEAEIARSVGASRTPVRAALARLSEDGLIETRPSRGNYVTRLRADAIHGAHIIRDSLESAAVALLANHGLPVAAAQALADNLAAAATAADAGDAGTFSALDDDFHRQLAEATGHDRLVQVLERERASLARLRALCPTEPGYMRYVLDEHTAIIDAIEARNEPLARSRLSAHVGRVLLMLEELQRRHADYFDDATDQTGAPR